MSAPDFLALLYEAYHSPMGLVVTTSDPLALRAKLYAEMRGNEDFTCLSLHISRSAPTSELIILRKPDEP